MQYERTFHIQSSHFNGRKQYDDYYELIDSREPSDELMEKALDVVKHQHGHNFRIEIMIDAVSTELLGSEGYLIDDIELEKIVKQYDNTCLSVHRDFVDSRERATTELIAKKLLEKVTSIADPNNDGEVFIQVTVYENENIKAIARTD